MSSSSSREVLHLSLGSTACNVTAHLLNLEGLAATCSDNGSSNDVSTRALCEASVTHTVSHHQTYVPRVLLTDEPASFRQSATTTAAVSSVTDVDVSSAIPTWNAALIETVEHRPQQQQPLVDALGNFLTTASTLAYSPYSRYHAPITQHQQTVSYSISDQNDRHVQWNDDDDDDDEQEPDEDELSEHEREELARRKRNQWRLNQGPIMQHQLNEYWTSTNSNIPAVPQETASQQVEAAVPASMAAQAEATTAEPVAAEPSPLLFQDLTWMDVWMPPRNPASCLPFSCHADSELVNHWDSYTTGTGANAVPVVSEWTAESLFESVRVMLEDCDSCQGVTIASSGHGVYAGLATVLLQELQQECPGAARWVWSIQESNEQEQSTAGTSRGESSLPPAATSSSSSSSWHSSHVKRLRRQVETALAWHDHVDLATSVLPLQLPTRQQDQSYLTPAAVTAVALESVTLPYRLAKSAQSSIGLNSYYYGNFGGESPFGTTPRLSFGEFLSSLQPSPRHNVLELDTMLPATSLNDKRQLWDRLQEGTSVERDLRMRDRRVNVRNVTPGSWMLDQGMPDGLLTALSPQAATKAADRSVQHHFGLSTAVRQNIAPSATTTQYVTCMMQGMGIRYRPEASIATVANQSLATLTEDGYGAGSYWPTVWEPAAPVLSVLGNSTRSYSHLHDIGADMKQAFLPRNRGYYNRDVATGLLPEAEDCQDALAYAFDVRDLYRPPEGSGLVYDEEGTYFDQS